MSCDLKDFFLVSPMKESEYMKVLMKYFPQDMITKYNLEQLVDSRDNVFVKINIGMYSLKQAAILTFQQPAEILKKAGYT